MDAAIFEKLIEQKSLSLDTAAAQIRKACPERPPEPAEQKGTAQEKGDARNGSSGRRPFFFLVGAGISYPPIPLASSIEEDCRKFATAGLPSGEADGAAKPIDAYSYWFDQAYPHPLQRQLYLRQLIQERTISHASFRLAHLLHDGRIANVVVTPNFDDFISRVLTLFGKPCIVCDHPATVERISPEQDDIQILHVHGSYWFYDCANLRNEIADRALSSMQTNRTMAYKLDDVMERSSPIVIGYSGWEEDVIMTALRRRLSSTLPYRMYWFCYQDPKPDTFPDWLLTHPQVFFVTPSAQKGDAAPAAAAHAAHQVAEEQKKEREGLGATIVLERLIREFKPDVPQLFTDPLEFFAKQLEASLPEGESGARGDIYFFKSLVAEVREINRRKGKVAGTQLRGVIDAIRRSDVHGAIKLARDIKFKECGLDDTQLRELMNAMRLAGAGLLDGSEEELQAYDIAIAAGRKVLENNPNDVDVRGFLANAVGSKSDVLRMLGRPDDALKMMAEVEKLVGDSKDVRLRRLLARTMLIRGVMYAELKGEGSSAEKSQWKKKEIEVTDALAHSFDADLGDPQIAVDVALGINNEAYLLLLKSKKLLQKDDKKAEATRKEIMDLLDRALDLSPKHPLTLANMGYLECLTGNQEKSRELMTEAINRGGAWVKSAALKDAEKEPLVARDATFKEIVKAIDVTNDVQEVGKPAA